MRVNSPAGGGAGQTIGLAPAQPGLTDLPRRRETPPRPSVTPATPPRLNLVTARCILIQWPQSISREYTEYSRCRSPWLFCLCLLHSPSRSRRTQEFAKLVRSGRPSRSSSARWWTTCPKPPACPLPRMCSATTSARPRNSPASPIINRYYRALAAASPRVKVLPAGRTDEGRECLVVAVSPTKTPSATSIRTRVTWPGWPIRAAWPKPSAKRIIAQAKPIYCLTGGLHSAETGPPEMLMELAYRLAVEDSPLFDQIRQNVIVMIIPPPSPTAATATWTGITATRLAEEERERPRRRARPTGASTSTTTTTATSITRRSPCATG